MTKRSLEELSSTLVFLVSSLFAAALLSMVKLPTAFSSLDDGMRLIEPIVYFVFVFGSQFLVSEWLLRRYFGSGKLLTSVLLGVILGIVLLVLTSLL